MEEIGKLKLNEYDLEFYDEGTEWVKIKMSMRYKGGNQYPSCRFTYVKKEKLLRMLYTPDTYLPTTNQG